MKRLLIAVLMLAAAFGARANSLTVNNVTGCDYFFVVYTSAPGGCGLKTGLIFIQAGKSVTFANTSVAPWIYSGCSTPAPDFTGFALYDVNTTAVPSLAFVGPLNGWPAFASYTTSNPCSGGLVQWHLAGPDVIVDIN